MKMFYRKDNCLVEVYNFFEDKTALIFSPSTAGRQNGNGPLFEGSVSKIPWTLIDFPIGPINIDTYHNSDDTICPRIIIDVIDDIEKEEEFPF